MYNFILCIISIINQLTQELALKIKINLYFKRYLIYTWKYFLCFLLTPNSKAHNALNIAQIWSEIWLDTREHIDRDTLFSLKCWSLIPKISIFWSMVPKLFSDRKLKYWLFLSIRIPRSLISIPWPVIPIPRLWSLIPRTMSRPADDMIRRYNAIIFASNRSLTQMSKGVLQ